ncbi:Serine decarboxylase 1 [Sesamum alatum]|uniref:Serine decarboxylase 1 n=1 Tax=Sesamum alatum TaxID=300844 RepID=A0AAE1Y246_9LAMI|nr:Serine decarboxylase 1 [Sesamum alatum]
MVVVSSVAIEEKDWNENKKREDVFVVVEPTDEGALDRQKCLTKIMTEFQEHLTERASHLLGFPVNMNCNYMVDLSPFLCFYINNVGDPYKESNFSLHSKKFEVGVLDWFARLWEIDMDEYWGYVTNGGTESNLHALMMGSVAL